ncbi:hypothetical protein MTO96_008898 [Rhipicephalus appendiculatus]
MRTAAVLVLVSLSCSYGHGLRVDKSTGAYEDVVVAIDPSVKPDERIVDNIKALFRSASAFLHRATRGLVHFGSVTIAIPDTWPARPQAKNTTANMFPVADVRVAAQNPQYGDTPYTLQPRGCGERGEYVLLTPRFLNEMNDSIADAYGSPAYLLVHEWAHFRYGVFDEYGDPESFWYPSLYCEFGMVRASSCSERHKFMVYTDSGHPCRIYKGCHVSSKCKTRFQQRSEDPVTSSIMFIPYIKGVTDFCDSANKTHNVFAPTKHNHLCNRKSTWEVISAHEDFQGLTAGDPEKFVEVKFTEVQKREGTLGSVIFALDASGSMAMLKENGQRPEGSVIVLMTDGEENAKPDIDDVMQELIAAQVVVNTIAFGSSADKKLEELSLRTGGKPFALPEGQSNVPVAIESAFLDSALALVDESKRPIVVRSALSFDQEAKVDTVEMFPIIIDSALGKETVVVLQSNETSELTAYVLYPDYKKCEDCLVSGPAVSGKYVTFKIPGVATPGSWTLVVHRRPSSRDVRVRVRATSVARGPDEAPVTVRAFLKRTEVSRASEAAVYAERCCETKHVLHHELCLSAGADVTANDGIYSGYFTRFDGVGRYSVSARVVSGNDSVIVEGRQASRGLPALQLSAPASGEWSESTDEVNGIPLDRFVYVDQDIEEAEPRVLRTKMAPEFARYAEGGSFRLTSDIDSLDYPTGLDTGPEGRGRAVDGKLPAGAVGTRQRLRFSLADALLSTAKNDSHQDFYFAARVWNDDKLSSPVSNVARVTFERPPFEAKPSANGTRWWVIVLCVLAAVFIVVALFIAAFKVTRWRKRDDSVSLM